MRSLALASVAMLAIAHAQALEISAGSRLNIAGNANFTGSTISFSTPADLLSGAGDFTTLGTCTGCVNMTTPLQYNPPTFGLVYSAATGLTATTFTTDALLNSQSTANTLDLTYSGTATLTGFDPTPGEWVLTLNQFGQLTGSFSATTAPIPEPAGLGVLGLGLIGLGLARRQPLRFKHEL